MDAVRVAVVGGGIGQAHLQSYRRLSDRFDVVTVCDVDADRAAATAGAFGVADWCADLNAVCARDDVEVIDICTPPHLHVEHTLSALAAGKHVVCEKPVAPSLHDLDMVVAAASAAGRLVMPILQYRFGAGIQKLKALVDAGLTGDAYTASAELAWRRGTDYYAVPWRGRWATEMGGVLVSQGIHALDMLTWILGPPARAFARLTTRVNPIEVDDCASVSLLMADGSLVSFTATLGSAEEVSRHRFAFSHLSAESNPSPYRNSLEPWTFVPADPRSADEIGRVLDAFVPGPQGYTGQFAGLAHAVRGEGSLPVTLDDARGGLELLTAVYHSAATGEDVPVAAGPDHPLYKGWQP